MTKIMIVDDDPNLRELVSTLLKNNGFEAAEASDGRDAFSIIMDVNPDLMIVDLMMPNMDGYSLCRKLKQYYADKPVLMLTAKGELSSKIEGFEAGADDYLTKPFEGVELIMRIKALLRRYQIEASQAISIGNVVIDRNSYTVVMNGVQSDIPMKEFELLFKLAGSPGRTFNRGTLIEDVWGYDFNGSERTLDVHIMVLSRLMPMTYCVDLARAVAYAGLPEYSSIVMFNPVVNLAAIAGLTVVFLVIGTFFFARSNLNR
ncbi:MAG: response regulator transcription factor [Coriobacteriia bacterium]|nr:response regulator transcription factor [Coriobacteriia bacterium]